MESRALVDRDGVTENTVSYRVDGRLPITEFAHKTRIISDVDVCALLAERDVSAESRRTATLNGRHHLQLLEAHVTGVGLTPSGPMIAEDIRDLQSWTGHPRALRGRLVSCGAQRC